MSGAYGESDRAESIATVHAALDAGVTLLDTGDFYGMGHNELLLAQALRSVAREDYQLSVKFGAQLGPDVSWVGFDTSPAATKSAAAYSLQRLGTDYIDIYRPARLDPRVPIEDTIGAIGELVDAGYVRHIGLSEVGSETIRRAAAVRPIADLQIEYSLVSRGVERDILDTCRELGIGVTAYGVLSGGLIGGHWTKSSGGQGDFRSERPRFVGDNLDRNLALVDTLRGVANELRVSVAQAAIAWVASRGTDIVPVLGARTRERLAEALGATEVALTDEQLILIEKAVPAEAVAGDRYGAAQMAALDSER
jgi:aryl-alcohol dehydrogenase-like predicted oxidoreductase